MKTKKIKHILKRNIQKILIWIKTQLNGDEYLNIKLDDSQKKAVSICIKMINHSDSELLTSILSEKRYIRNSDYFVIISSFNIKIVNHIYSYDIPINGRKIYNLKRLFDAKIDLARIQMENEILSNVKHSLDDINKNLSKL